MAETSVQRSLVDTDVERRPERIVMSLNSEYYELIWAGLKRHEFRRRFLEGQPVEWFVYLTAPVSRLAAVIELDAAVVDVPAAIAELAEQARPGNGASVLAYVEDLPRAFAMPIRRVREYSGLDAVALKAELRNEDLSAEPDAWEYDANGNIVITGTSLAVPARSQDHP